MSNQANDNANKQSKKGYLWHLICYCKYLADFRLLLSPNFAAFSQITDNVFLTGIGGIKRENIETNRITCILNISKEIPSCIFSGIDSFVLEVWVCLPFLSNSYLIALLIFFFFRWMMITMKIFFNTLIKFLIKLMRLPVKEAGFLFIV